MTGCRLDLAHGERPGDGGPGIGSQAAQRLVLHLVVGEGDTGTVCDFLAQGSALSKSRIKDAMDKGAVWLQKKQGRARRLRRATTPVHAGDSLMLYYDPVLLAIAPPQGRCLHDLQGYSVWYKPAGLMAQGTQFGDHCSLPRQAQMHFRPIREVYVVHRLDREAAGLMLLAHTRQAAAQLSELFRQHQVEKRYRVEVRGDLAACSAQGAIELPLDGKPAFTAFRVLGFDPLANTSIVEVTLKTGRLHQIRRHFDMLGFPVMGDPRYGQGNKNAKGLRLAAVGLRFVCPVQKQEREFVLGDDFWL